MKVLGIKSQDFLSPAPHTPDLTFKADLSLRAFVIFFEVFLTIGLWYSRVILMSEVNKSQERYWLVFHTPQLRIIVG
ncbi:MAG TPA: hypothetical protein DEG47_16930 [Cyanobacteria bacterium UBA11148]|nr:hypothetical protein [Cyanobacteria bacterium UBA11148]